METRDNHRRLISFFSQESSDNLYARQPAYNPSYKPVEDTVETVTNRVDRERIVSAEEKDDTCVTFCILGVVVVAAALAVIVFVLYLVVNNAHSNHLSRRAKNTDRDQKLLLITKIFNSTIGKRLAKHNKTYQ
ncbi:uncharacterized protein LOC143148257 [Ptiloglossa arizonensis]|uniref:uncharacterized protein LOC143148257 n=1 Tax=Ptiloglossa arizonensis TaxID=3350558 RepID=UPI003FA14597